MINKDCVYITRSNFEKILRSIDQKSFDNPDYSELFERDVSFILTTKEMNILYSAMKAFEDLSFISEHYHRVRKIDTMNYAFEGGSPAYHYDLCCERLNSDFINLEMPPEIKESGRVEEYREFCRINIDIIENDISLFYKKLDAKFILKNPPNRFVYENSGTANIENMSLEELKTEANKIIDEAHAFKNESDYNKKIIKDKGYGTHIAPEAKIEGSVLYIWHNKYKTKLKKVLKEYYRVRLNSELKFEGSLLEQLGFVPCTKCKPQY